MRRPGRKRSRRSIARGRHECIYRCTPRCILLYVKINLAYRLRYTPRFRQVHKVRECGRDINIRPFRLKPSCDKYSLGAVYISVCPSSLLPSLCINLPFPFFVKAIKWKTPKPP